MSELTSIKGIGKTTAAKLQQAGFGTIALLAAADPTAPIDGVTSDDWGKWIEGAKTVANDQANTQSDNQSNAKSDKDEETKTDAEAEDKGPTGLIVEVTAPKGPRRRGGINFGPKPVKLIERDLGEDFKDIMELIGNDKRLVVRAIK